VRDLDDVDPLLGQAIELAAKRVELGVGGDDTRPGAER
jgi:hypothetical protein